MKKIIFFLCVSIGINLFATTVGDLTSTVCKDATYPCDICSNESSTMAQCKCEAGTSWNSTLKICETAKDACTSPAYWNDTKKTCEAVVTTTTAPTKTAWLKCKASFPLCEFYNGGIFNPGSTLTVRCLKSGYDNPYFDSNCVLYKEGGGASVAPDGPLQLGGAAVVIQNQTAANNQYKYVCDDGTDPVGGSCITKLFISKPNNCSSPYTGVTSSGKCYQPTSCPLGSEYACTSTSSNGGGTIEDTDTTQGATDKTANGTTDSTGQCSGKVYIFNGKDMRCRPPGTQTGYSDCCTKTDSWFGLTKCGTSEVALGKARVSGNSGDGYCHYVGSYCAEEWNLGVTKVCVQKKKTYCCFNGLLGRVIQEQGRPQLGIGWGSSEAPECRGFTPDEFQKLDFSKIDLGEFTQAVTANAAANINKNLGPQINAEIDRFNSTIK